MPFPVLGSNSAVAAGYEIDNSLRFNGADTPTLKKTFGTPTDNKIFTFSFWTKISKIDSGKDYFTTGSDGNTEAMIRIESGNKLLYKEDSGGSSNVIRLFTTQVFRDVSAYYHILISQDTTQSTASNRVKLYVNGNQITVFDASTYPNQNTTSLLNASNSHTIGNRNYDTAVPVDAYMSDVNFIDGQALAPTEFGETNDNGVWIPKAYEGTYGNNGFFLEFKNSGSLGTDTSGNGNNFTATNLTATDQTTDTPTNNFATILSIYASSETNPPSSDFSEGNTKFVASTSAHSYGRCSIGVSSGKWYVETKITEGGTGQGSALMSVPVSSTDIFGDTQGAGFQVQLSSSNTQLRKKDKGVETTIFTDFASGNIAQMALDLDNGKMWLGNNGTWYNNNNASTTLDSDNPDITGLTSEMRLFAINSYKSGSDVNTMELNFGNPSFTISSGNSDANGYGNFEYAVPSGYYSLCTKNLAEYG